MSNTESLHEGHRDRVRKRFLESGLDGFEPHQALEMLLFYSIPRRDTNEIAHHLLSRFNNSISAVFDAPVEELVKTDYITENTAVLIKMIPELMRMYMSDRASSGETIKSTEQAKNFFRPKFFGRTNELFVIALIDNGGKVINSTVISEGTVNAARIDLRKIIKLCVTNDASGCFAAHNHPRGSALPSEEDISSTKRMITALRDIGVRLHDHIIFGEGETSISLASSYRYGTMFNEYK